MEDNISSMAMHTWALPYMESMHETRAERREQRDTDRRNTPPGTTRNPLGRDHDRDHLVDSSPHLETEPNTDPDRAKTFGRVSPED